MLNMQIKEDIVRIEYWLHKIWPYQLKKEHHARYLEVTDRTNEALWKWKVETTSFFGMFLFSTWKMKDSNPKFSVFSGSSDES